MTHLQQLEHWWAEGLSRPEMARRLGVSIPEVVNAIRRGRRAGAAFPKRRTAASGKSHYAWKGADATQRSQRLRAEATFALGPCERCGGKAVDRHHIDGDTNNNVRENIALLCRRCHMEIDGRINTRGSRNGFAKLNEHQVMAIKRALGDGGSVCALARAFGVNPSTITNIKAGNTWRHVHA